MNDLKEHNQDEIRELLMGRRVTKISDDTVILDNGTKLRIEGNDGCGGCISGWYNLTELNECPDNAIMNVEFETDHNDDDVYDEHWTFKVFVLAADRRIKLWEVDGDDGNGYYGTGYWIRVTNE